MKSDICEYMDKVDETKAYLFFVVWFFVLPHDKPYAFLALQKLPETSECLCAAVESTEDAAMTKRTIPPFSL